MTTESSLETNDPILEHLQSFYGNEEKASEWFTVTQEDINQFSEATHDPDWMHIDPERARRDGPFDGTIAYGFWTLSMLTRLTRATMGGEYPPGIAYGFNYGLNRVRLMEPLPVGARIRNHARVLSVEKRGAGRYLVTTENRVEIEGVEKPAMMAEWLGMLVSE